MADEAKSSDKNNNKIERYIPIPRKQNRKYKTEFLMFNSN